MPQPPIMELVERYLKIYVTHFPLDEEKENRVKAPLAAAELWVPRLGRTFYGVSQNIQRVLEPNVMNALNRVLRELGAGGVSKYHGMCAEPVAISKAIHFYKQAGMSISLAGSTCRAYEIPLTGGTLNPSTATFRKRNSFGDRKDACPSCEALLRLFNITEG